MKKDLPFFAISNEELAQKPPVGTHVVCKNCGKKHKVEYGKTQTIKTDGTKSEPVEDSQIGFTKCGDKTFLVAIAGKEI